MDMRHERGGKVHCFYRSVCSYSTTVVENKCIEIYLVVKRVKASATFHSVFQTMTLTVQKFVGVYRFSIWLIVIAL